MLVVDQRRVAHTETEQEASLPIVAPRRPSPRDLGRVLHPDIENARRDDDARGRAQQGFDGPEDVAAYVGYPDRAVTELVELDGRRGDGFGVAVAQLRRPD